MTSNTADFILVVEDNDVDREAVHRMVGHQTEVKDAPTLADALNTCRAALPHCVLLDLGLPDTDGLNGLKSFRQAYPLTPIIVITGMEDEALGLEATQLGAQDYLTKGTIDGPNLQRAIRYAVGRKTAENVALKNEEQLLHVQKQEAVGRLAGGLAHDFNNLLTVILNNASLGIEDEAAGRPVKENLNGIIEAANRGANLTRQLLAFSSSQALDPQALNLNEVIQDVSKMLIRLIGEDVRLSLNLDPNVGQIRGDRSQLEHILLNLSANARDAMPAGGELCIETTTITEESIPPDFDRQGKAGPCVKLRFVDTGCGIPPGLEHKIFEPFFTTKREAGGTGLGLAGVYGMVMQNGGHVCVDSKPGQGAAFSIYLPQIGPSTSKKLPQVADQKPPAGNETVLLVEDQKNIRQLLVMMLNRLGYKVIEAESGIQALECLKDSAAPIDLVISDVVMPGMSGPQWIDHAIKNDFKFKALFMSGHIDDSIKNHILFGSKVDFLEKPFTSIDLSRKVRDLLDRP